MHCDPYKGLKRHGKRSSYFILRIVIKEIPGNVLIYSIFSIRNINRPNRYLTLTTDFPMNR